MCGDQLKLCKYSVLMKLSPKSIFIWWLFPESIIQFSSVSQSCLTLCDPMDCSTPGSPSITNSQSLLKLMSVESVMPSNHLILYCPLLLPPSIFPSIRVFPVSQFFTSGGQSIGALAAASVLPINVQAWFPLGLTGLISSKFSRVFTSIKIWKHQFFGALITV